MGMNWREMLPKWNPLHREPQPERRLFSFCETVTAGGGSPWHIRPLTERGRMLSGGADTMALCGRKVSWDVRAQINEANLRGACNLCALTYRSKA
jgi:hypothetical protein